MRRAAAFVLGNSFDVVTDPSVETLAQLLRDDDDLVRSNAAYGLGMAARSGWQRGQRIAELLIERLTSGCEVDNTHSGGLARSTVREELCAALVQVVCNHQLDGEQCNRLTALAADWLGRDRYAAGLLIECLQRSSAARHDRLLAMLARRQLLPAPLEA